MWATPRCQRYWSSVLSPGLGSEMIRVDSELEIHSAVSPIPAKFCPIRSKESKDSTALQMRNRRGEERRGRREGRGERGEIEHGSTGDRMKEQQSNRESYEFSSDMFC
eukprot:768651-Hanusia_phi.AAC.2